MTTDAKLEKITDRVQKPLGRFTTGLSVQQMGECPVFLGTLVITPMMLKQANTLAMFQFPFSGSGPSNFANPVCQAIAMCRRWYGVPNVKFERVCSYSERAKALVGYVTLKYLVTTKGEKPKDADWNDPDVISTDIDLQSLDGSVHPIPLLKYEEDYSTEPFRYGGAAVSGKLIGRAYPMWTDSRDPHLCPRTFVSLSLNTSTANQSSELTSPLVFNMWGSYENFEPRVRGDYQIGFSEMPGWCLTLLRGATIVGDNVGKGNTGISTSTTVKP